MSRPIAEKMMRAFIERIGGRAIVALVLLATAGRATAAEQVLLPKLRYLNARLVSQKGNSAGKAQTDGMYLDFSNDRPASMTLRLRHRNLSRPWKLRLNGRAWTTISATDNDTIALLPITQDLLVAGRNRLDIIPGPGRADGDEALGEIRLIDQSMNELMTARVDARISDAYSGKPLPARLTFVDQRGTLVPLTAEPSPDLAVRTGVVYTGCGHAAVSLMPGKYTVYASRGFEYSDDSEEIEVRHGTPVSVRLGIRRLVDTRGYVACDTHCHTFTYSRHGDATIAERMVTLAGEGIELPVSTDHNVAIDYDGPARAAGLRQYFTPIIGDELTTRVGHFNVFPLDPGRPPLDHRAEDWAGVFAEIAKAPEVRMIVLNHARDIHAGFRPFDPHRHLASAGEDLAGWQLKANAMEVVNSGATQNDPLRLIRDWLGLLNRGLRITPIGSSDSHDVSRYIVGQGRTYVRCRDDDPGKIDVSEALQSLQAGRVSVSYGLFVELSVDGKYGPGELAPRRPRYDVTVRVRSPHWIDADALLLLANGIEVRRYDLFADQFVLDDRRGDDGLQAEVTYTFEPGSHDVHLVAVARGPGSTGPFWPLARPYQPSSPDWTPYVLGVSGALYIDVDGDGSFTSAHGYAQRLTEEAGHDYPKLMNRLAGYDEAVAIQAASIARARGADVFGESWQRALAEATPTPARGVRRYIDELRASREPAPETQPSERPKP